MLEEIFSRGWQDFLDRTEEPMSFRFVLQPAVAGVLGVRAGFRDLRPYPWRFSPVLSFEDP
jgi:hypothetical protein